MMTHASDYSTLEKGTEGSQFESNFGYTGSSRKRWAMLYLVSKKKEEEEEENQRNRIVKQNENTGKTRVL